MDWIPVVFFIIAYFWVGSCISDLLEKGNDDVWTMLVFIAWPAVLLIITLYICLERIYRRNK